MIIERDVAYLDISAVYSSSQSLSRFGSILQDKTIIFKEYNQSTYDLGTKNVAEYIETITLPTNRFPLFCRQKQSDCFVSSHSNVYLINQQDHQSATRASRLNADNVFTGECVLHSLPPGATQCNIYCLTRYRTPQANKSICTKLLGICVLKLECALQVP